MEQHTITDWKKMARLLKEVYAEIQKEALSKGIDILSPEYDELINNARILVLEKNGWTLEEYRSLKEQIEGIDKAGTLEVMKDTQKKIKTMSERMDDFHIPTSEEIEEIAEQVAQKYIVPPQITNQVIERIIEKRPIKETIRVKERVEYDDKPIRKEIKRVLQQIDEIKIPEQISIEKLKKELKSDFSVFFEHNINTLDMPNFRKLAMGLQGQIDDLVNNPSAGGGHTIQDEGTPLTQRTNINFVGAGVTVTDGGAGTNDTIITISGGGSSDANKLNIDQTTPQTTVGRFTFPNVNIGQDTGAGDLVNQPFTIGGSINDYFGAYIQNLNTGDSVYTDLVIGADNDGTDLIGHFLDLGIAGSGYSSASVGNVATVSVNAGGTGYVEDDEITLSGAGDTNAIVRVLTLSGSAVATVEIIYNGTGYAVASAVTTTGGTGSGCTINVLSLIANSLVAGDTFVNSSGGNLNIGTDESVAGKGILFYTGGGDVSNDRMSIDANGNIGIGTKNQTSLFQVTQPIWGIGTVSNSAGGTTVTGVGTQFTNTFKIGDTITINGQTVAITAIASNTSMTTAAITGANTAVAYTLATGNRFVVKGNGNVGIGTTSNPTGKLDIQGSVVNNLPTYSAEFLLSTGWTSTDWTGSFAAGWDHTTGNVSVLSQSKAAVTNSKYQIAYIVTGRTAGTFSIGFGGQSLAGQTVTGAWGPTATSTASLTITPTSTFDGAIVISIRSLTAVSTPLVNLKSSDGVSRIEMRVNTAASNTFIGLNSGRYNTTGFANTGVGTNTLQSNTTGGNNIAMGLSALQANTVGYANTAIGISALQNNTTGIYNVALGTSALTLNTTGQTNMAIGLQSLYTNSSGIGNVAIGVSAMYYNQTGSNNVAIGVTALVNNTTGTYNAAIGFDAGKNIADGTTANATSDYSVYIGTSTRAGADNNQNEIVIGYAAIGAGSNTIRLGNTSVTDLYMPGKFHLQSFATAPASATATGVAGTVIIQTDYIYVCSATDTWVRTALTTW